MSDTTMATAEDRALGTGVRVVVTRPSGLAAAKQAVDAVLRAVDDTCSRFREDSELSRLNAAAGREVQVSPLLARTLEEGLRGARLTGGDVDPTVGRALRLSGYDVDFDAVPRDGAALHIAVHPVPGWQTVQWNRVTRSVLVPRGVELDLGATAKAYAADLAAAAAFDALARSGGVLVSLGGDIGLAGIPPSGGWLVQVSDDSNTGPDPSAETVLVQSGGVATSSTTVRRWTRGGVELHHIIDPRTGVPAVTPWRLATVVADSCVDANIASTAAIVRGAAALPWLDGLGLPSRLLGRDGSDVRVGGWPLADDVAPGLAPTM
jgi:thiamine biosynthesis lipoprotein